MTALRDPDQSPLDGPPAPDATELKRTVGLLLATQQELIDLRYRRDREQRVLEGIVGFTEDVQTRSGKQAFWESVVDSTVKAFDCETAIGIEWDGTTMTVLASRGPVPASDTEARALCEVACACSRDRTILVADADVEGLRFNGQPLAMLMVAPVEGEPREVTHLLLLAVTRRKQPFFPTFDVHSVPGLRMFASTVATMREMHRSRTFIQDQVRELDRANSELARRMEEQLRSATEQERLRSQLAQARRMESLGRLAGGVAHDFNNLLTVIYGNAELIKEDPDLSPDDRQSITEVLEATGRARALTQQLLMFSRKQVIRPQPLHLNQQIEESLRLYRRIIGEDITLGFTPCADETIVLADKQQFDQLLSNLLLNARDAIHEVPLTGRISEIRVATEVVRQGSPLHAGAPAVRLTVTDTGIGMDEATRQNIFEPFFSTKAMGKGTGLGLSTVLGVIQQNQGAIEVTSVKGEGSTFLVYWPLQLGEEFEAVPEPLDVRPTGENRRVLLVEDEDQVRNLMVRGLSRLGFAVTACESGDSALAHLADGMAPPDVLVTDVVMPRMNGRQLAEAALARHPALPILFVSGYTDDIVSQQGIVPEGVELLSKPFTPDMLGRRIRQLLDGRRTG